MKIATQNVEWKNFFSAANRRMDVALYVGLALACAFGGGLALLLIRLVRRKGRDHALYSMARNAGKYFLLFRFLCLFNTEYNSQPYTRLLYNYEYQYTRICIYMSTFTVIATIFIIIAVIEYRNSVHTFAKEFS